MACLNPYLLCINVALTKDVAKWPLGKDSLFDRLSLTVRFKISTLA